jgi:predicted ATP-grasp superfamily ATP-dependent carboligase
MRVLVLDSGNTAAYHVMRTLAQQGHQVHLASSEDSPAFSSRYCAGVHRAPPVARAGDYLAFLVDVVSRGEFGVMFFCGDHEAELIWDRRDALQPYVNCLLPAHRHREVAFSKFAAYDHVERLGLGIPRTRLFDSLAELTAALADFSFPVVIKGEKGSAGRQVRFAGSADEAESHAREVAELARAEGGRVSVQEYVPGDGYVVHTLFFQGRTMAVCSHRKDREYPVGGGVTSAATTVHHPELDEAALTIMASLDWHGLAKLDFKRDSRDGSFKFIELDPRVSASIDITRAAGCDQVALACELVAGRSVAPRLGYRAGVRYRWVFPRDAIVLLPEPWRYIGYLPEMLARDAHWDISPADPRPFLRSLRALASHLRHQIDTRKVWRQRQLDSRLRESVGASAP